MTKTHYIAMAGLHGCLPQTCACFDSAAAAVEYLGDVHDLGQHRRRELRKFWYLELDLHRDGNEYCEITDCTCSTPQVHGDN